MKKLFLILFFLVFTVSFAQNDSIFNRLQGIYDNGLSYFNIDGYSITYSNLNKPFTTKGLKKAFRKYSISKEIIKTKDKLIPHNNFYAIDDIEINDKLIQNNSYYFIENSGLISIIQFSSLNKKRDKNFERKIVKHILDNTIPEENYTSIKIDTINFVDRKIKLGNNCYWTNVNSVQCPYYGQINWSIHKDLDDAKNAVKYQLDLTKSRKNGKVISEEIVEIEFEGVETNAKKVIYDFTGITSVLASLSGGKTLTVYYVATKVRDKNISCVLSFWDNDVISKNNLPPLLEEVMKLKE